jgi:hypothetical protein
MLSLIMLNVVMLSVVIECPYAECRGATLAYEGKSATIFCRQMSALVQAMFYNFYLVKNHKIADNSATTEPRARISTYFLILRILVNF